jgi:hypothetical protein
MFLSIRSVLLAAFSALFLLFAPAPAQAQGQFVSAGHGTYLAADQTTVLEFTYVIKVNSNGSAHGFAAWRGPDSLTIWRVDSATFIDETLAFAGQVVAIFGSPPPGQVVGGSVFTGFRDNGPGSVDETLSLSVVPPEFGNPTIQEIIALIGAPPPQAYRPLLTGNVWIP